MVLHDKVACFYDLLIKPAVVPSLKNVPDDTVKLIEYVPGMTTIVPAVPFSVYISERFSYGRPANGVHALHLDMYLRAYEYFLFETATH